MKKKLLGIFAFSIFSIGAIWAENDYGIPTKIQDGNILHCFNWPISTVKNLLPEIAEAGYGSVQLSPLQRKDVQSNWHWYDLYCPYDIALQNSAALGSKSDLISLCEEAEKYGIKVIVDVVANHINWTNKYYNDAWWSVGDRTRAGRSQSGSINYNNRQQITQNRLGDYFEVNSENEDVIQRTVEYIQELADCGVKGIRWDAAKHIALPSESFGGPFWARVTSCVPGMYHYGEILDDPANGQGALIKEYAKYMSVTDNRYSNTAARTYNGVAAAAHGTWVNNQGLPPSKMVYWGESHDTYSNDEWSQNKDQSVIDRAYATVACRQGATALYLGRPSNKGFGSIQIKKGTDAYKGKAVAEVNKFRNVMTGRAESFTKNGSNECCITRDNGGAVIVMKTNGEVSIANGNGYCPEGTYIDRVAGGTFTVTKSTIKGTVGESGIAVLYKDELGSFTPVPDDDFDDDNKELEVLPYAIVPEGQFAIFVKSSSSPNIWVWTDSGDLCQNGWPGDKLTSACTDDKGTVYYYWVVPQGITSVNCILNYSGDDDKTQDLKNITKNTYFEYNGVLSKGQELTQMNVPSGITILPAAPTGVEGIREDEVDPVYFNLQGVVVKNPSKGIFIKVTPNKREKVYLK